MRVVDVGERDHDHSVDASAKPVPPRALQPRATDLPSVVAGERLNGAEVLVRDVCAPDAELVVVEGAPHGLNVSHAEDGNRFERKNRDRRHSAGASPQAKTIKLADLIDNTRSLLDYDSHFAQTYLIEKQRLLEVLTEGDPTLWRQASHIVEQGLLRLQQPPHNVPASWFEHARRRYRESDAA